MEKLNVYCAIVGGGASALMCGCIAKSRHKDKRIVILEKDNRVGKKILVSGNGRCNLTNTCASKNNYYGSFDNGIYFLLENYPPSKIIEYFNCIGLMCTVDSENRVYPLSKQSSAVLSVLRNEANRKGIEEVCDCVVEKIEKTADGFVLNCADKKIYAHKVVIATGGKNNYAQKVVMDTHKLAKNLGHNITATTPSLSPVKVNSPYLKSLKGIRSTGAVIAVVNNKQVKTEYGEIQFTEKAISGICAFNLSRILNNADNAKIIVKLLNNYSFEEIKEMISRRIDMIGKENVQTIFDGMFHKNIGIVMLKASGIDTSKTADKLSEIEITKLARTIDSLEFDVVKNNDYSQAQVTAGGVDGNQINPHTMESKLHKNLFICGECIDTDGDCGGFNLQFAFMSGMCAGENI